MSELVADLPSIHKALGAVLDTAHTRMLTHTKTHTHKEIRAELMS